MSVKLIGSLCLGTALMAGVLLFCRRWYPLPWWKVALFAPLLTACGLAGVKVLFFIENGSWSGLSFFGAVLLIPFLLIGVALLLKIPYRQLLDMAAPAICIMLALMKVYCLISGCCKGRVLYENALGDEVRFPSQMVELVNALVVMVVLLVIISKQTQPGRLYPWFMVIYGVTRFFWNWFRQTDPFIGLLPAGNWWAIVSVVMGVIWLLYLKQKEKKQPNLAVP